MNYPQISADLRRLHLQFFAFLCESLCHLCVTLCSAFLGAFMPKLRPGQPAPDVILKTLEGMAVPLSSLWGNGRTALLIFLRHLA